MEQRFKKIKTSWKNLFSENASYLVVSLFVSLILWVTLLSRKEATFIKEVPIEYIFNDPRYFVKEAPRSVKVEVSGPRIAVRRFSEDAAAIALDLAGVGVGSRRIRVPAENLALPPRVMIRGIQPSIIFVEIGMREEGP